MRDRPNKLTAVEFTFGQGGPERTFVFIFGAYCRDAVDRFVHLNPEILDMPNLRHRPIMTWHTPQRFFKWALSRQRKLLGWTLLGDLAC